MRTRQAPGDFFINYFPHCGAVSRSFLIARTGDTALAARESFGPESKKARRSRRACTERTLGRIRNASGFADLDAPF
jgi:hypothetical protein